VNYWSGGMSQIEDVIKYLCEQKIMLTTAESCTAGLVTSLLAEIPGCGAILHMGFVVYTEQAKHHCLGVNWNTMQKFGLTSEEVAKEMAVGALRVSQANIAVAITGTAESDDDLNGVICFAFSQKINHEYKVISETLTLKGERNKVRYLAAMHAILSIPMFHQKLSLGEGETAA
jgi:nicotinamide-nucleotide amidase